jgi:hypothetical protein
MAYEWVAWHVWHCAFCMHVRRDDIWKGWDVDYWDDNSTFSLFCFRTRCSWLALYTCTLETPFGWGPSSLFGFLGFFW